MADLRNILERFGFVTVLEPTFYEADDDGLANPLFVLDSLTVANITQEGPTKTAKGGLYAETLMRYGKTMRLEMEDVLGRIDVLEKLMKAEVTNGAALLNEVVAEDEFIARSSVDKIFYLTKTSEVAAGDFPKVYINNVLTGTVAVSGKEATVTGTIAKGDKIRIVYKTKDSGVAKIAITDKFRTTPVKIVGKTFVINQKNGEKQWVNLTFNRFLPDGIFDIAMEAEGDFGAMNIGGELFPNECGVFYYITEGETPAGC